MKIVDSPIERTGKPNTIRSDLGFGVVSHGHLWRLLTGTQLPDLAMLLIYECAPGAPALAAREERVGRL